MFDVVTKWHTLMAYFVISPNDEEGGREAWMHEGEGEGREGGREGRREGGR